MHDVREMRHPRRVSTTIDFTHSNVDYTVWTFVVQVRL